MEFRRLLKVKRPLNSNPLLYTIVGIIAITFIVLFFVSGRSNMSEVWVEVKEGPFEVIATAVGELSANSNSQFMIPVNELQRANLFEVNVSRLIPDGTLVDSGDFIMEFDKSAIYIRLGEIESELSKAKDEFEEAKLDTTLKMNEEREKNLDLKSDVIDAEFLVEQVQYESRSAIRTANNNLEKVKREFDRSQQKYRQIQMQSRLSVNKKMSELQGVIDKKTAMLELMDKMSIYSTGKGMIVYEKDQDGSRKKAGSKTQIFANPVVATIPDLKNLISKAFVNEIDVNNIKPGQSVKVIADAFMNKSYKGKVISVANMGTQLFGKDANLFEVIIGVENSDLKLKPSMRTNNFIQAASYPKVVYIPSDALLMVDTIACVYKKIGNSIVKQQVRIGEANENEVVILKGVAKGDQVLLSFPEEMNKYPLQKLTTSK